jgi:hypothetical protein
MRGKINSAVKPALVVVKTLEKRRVDTGELISIAVVDTALDYVRGCLPRPAMRRA